MASPKKSGPIRGSAPWSEQGHIERAITVDEFAAIAAFMVGCCRVIWYERRESALFTFPLHRRVSARSTDERLLKMAIRIPRRSGFDMETSGVAWHDDECSVCVPCDEERVRRLDQSGACAIIRPLMCLDHKKFRWSASIISVTKSALHF